ncbi:hypothetical protein TNCV_4251151 [Trichonephila clavipes]|nr:hypothetical protein TNCV_4251151 [Trichonephila clavipes]
MPKERMLNPITLLILQEKFEGENKRNNPQLKRKTFQIRLLRSRICNVSGREQVGNSGRTRSSALSLRPSVFGPRDQKREIFLGF